MSELAVENVNVADILGAEGAEENLEKVKEAIVSDAEVGPLVKAAQTVEDVYEIVKRFSKATLEQVKVIFEKTVDYFKETKVELSDEVLDNVAGGGFNFFKFWDNFKEGIVAGCIMVGCTVVGGVIGACVGGLGGAVAGACVGALVGAVAASGSSFAFEAAAKK